MRVAIAGAGYMSHVHARSLKAAGHELVMVSDADAAVAEAFGQQWGCPWTDGLEKLLAQKVDIVSIVVPNPSHYVVACAALDAGHAVLCEKPMTRSREDARALVEKVRKSGRLFFVGYMKRTHPTMLKFLEYARRIGRIRSGVVRTHHPLVGESYWDWIRDNMKKDPDRVFDGMIINGGSHMLDLLLAAAGPVKRVLGARLQYRPEFPTIDIAAHALFEMANGASVLLNADMLPVEGVGRHDNGWEEFIELWGEEGVATVHTTWWNMPEFECPVAELWHEPTKTGEKYNAGKVDYFVREYELLGKALDGEHTILATVEEGCRVDELFADIFDVAQRN